ncbi:DNA repair protein RecO [Streptococcus sp. 121]|uniref:DNA repair protein RecO n=1 Tax=Streptococcus sp. 121 TaxID=2797637 RepID=UPI0018F0D34D|nr:DNA repair protein RecO [Streptococcus sp. 121]MBJ6746533.1 DNA repair protein RecO [Streptococcus sp. 121]
METVQSKGLVLYNRPYREKDRLVKIFTEKAGKRMFFVRNVEKSQRLAQIQPLVFGDYILKLREEGLGYIDEVSVETSYPKVQGDIYSLAYASYVLALADASIQDGQADPALFQFVTKTLELMEEGLDYEVLTLIFEMQILDRFGTRLLLSECCLCHRTGLPFDYSFVYDGVLCPEHYDQDVHRAHFNPNSLFLLERFQAVSLEELESIRLSTETKADLRRTLDTFYQEYVGIHLKAKKFLDSLDEWGSLLKERK